MTRNIPGKIKKFVFERDQGKCVYCGSNKNLEFDHIIPASKGGSNSERNIQLICINCNRRKFDYIDDTFLKRIVNALTWFREDKIEIGVKTNDIMVRLIKIGNSLGFTIDKRIIRYVDLEEGDLVKITITKENLKKE